MAIPDPWEETEHDTANPPAAASNRGVSASPSAIAHARARTARTRPPGARNPREGRSSPSPASAKR